MIYRLATATDCPPLAELRWQWRAVEDGEPASVSHEQFVAECAAFFAQGLAAGNWAYWLAEDDGVIASHVCVQIIQRVPSPNNPHPIMGYVTNVYTRPAYRNQGVASQLMQHVLRWANEQRLSELFVWPSERSVPFYLRAGFSADNDVLELELRPD